MLSIDTNILLYAYSASAPLHQQAKTFLLDLSQRDDIALSEFVLLEFYQLLRNPAVLERPLTPNEAADAIQSYRNHPRWRILGFPNDSKSFHQQLWQYASKTTISRRALFDCRIALSLRLFGVKEFATANVKDFQDFDFETVWNPLIPG